MKVILLYTLLFWNAMLLQSAQYFIAIGGDDSSPGTLEQPFASFLRAHTVAQPGDTIWVRGGTHTVHTIWTISKAGTVNAYYNLWGYTPDIERGDSVVLQVAASNGIRIQVGARFWHIRDLIIQNASDNGMRIEGSYHIIERCIFRNNADSGLTIQQSNGTMPNDGTIAAFNLVLNCDSYLNDRDVSNADGFACKLSPGAGNVFRGCRAWANGDDGWDFYYSRFQIIVEDCWTFSNGIKGGNGNGFKSNGSPSSTSTPRTQASHVYIRCIAFDHKYKAGSNNKGFDQNHNEGNVTMIHCLAFDNERNYAYYKDTQNGKNHVLRNCVGFDPFSESLARTLLPGEIFNAGTNNEISYLNSNTWFGNTIDATHNSWDLARNNPGWHPSRADYLSLSMSDAMAPRQRDGSLPNNGFGQLKPESKMINAGISYQWELELPLSTYPNNPNKPPYIMGTLVATPDGLPDLGPIESPFVSNPFNSSPEIQLLALTRTEVNVQELVTLTAHASDADGNIARVQFLVNNQVVGTAWNAPWQWSWNATAAGEFTFVAQAFDNEGAFTVSNTQQVVVKPQAGIVEGKAVNVLRLTGNSLADEIQQRNWITQNTTSLTTNGRIRLTLSSGRSGAIISPSIPLSRFKPDSLRLTFASAGGGNRNLIISVSTDGGNTFSAPILHTGAANGVVVPVSMAFNQNIADEGNWVIKLEAANTIDLWNVTVTAIEKIPSDIISTPMILNNIRCVPTVTTGFLILCMDLQESAPVQIGLYNLQGQKVSHIESQTYPAGQNRIIADISMSPPGMYLVRFSTNNEAITFKIVKN